MAFTRSANPIWFFDNLTGSPFDDTYFAFFLTNTLPYIPQAVYQDPNGSSPWNNPIEFNASSGLPQNLYFDPGEVYRIEFRQGNTQAAPLIWLVEDYVPTPVINPGLEGQLAFFPEDGAAISGGQLGDIAGTTTNDNAPAGNVGEFKSSTVPFASAISLSSTTSANVTTLSLTAGDYDVWGNVFINFGGSATSSIGWISTTSASLPDPLIRSETNNNGGIATGGGNYTQTIPQARFSLAITTTLYLSAQATFSTSTATACGGIYARRVR